MLASFGLASFGLASFGLASFGLASFRDAAALATTRVPGSQVKLERTWRATPWLRANSTDRRLRTRPPVAAISSISS